MIIAAIVVTYFPNEILLMRLLKCISTDVAKIYIVDNTPTEDATWLKSEWLIKSGFDIGYKSLEDNLGIAKAQNIGIDFSIQDGCDHVVFFDQDSAPPTAMLEKLIAAELKLLASGIKVGSIGPIFLDEKTKHYAPAIRHNGLFIKKIEVTPYKGNPVRSDYLISSGSLIRLSVLEEIGPMRVELFIDWVDIEWGLRAGNFGYMHFIIPDVVMLHSIGDQFTSIGKREINLHNDIRNYYIVRNACSLFLDKSINWQWRANIFLKIPLYVIFYSITALSKKRTKAFVLLLRACADGFMGRLGKAF